MPWRPAVLTGLGSTLIPRPLRFSSSRCLTRSTQVRGSAEYGTPTRAEPALLMEETVGVGAGAACRGGSTRIVGQVHGQGRVGDIHTCLLRSVRSMILWGDRHARVRQSARTMSRRAFGADHVRSPQRHRQLPLH